MLFRSAAHPERTQEFGRAARDFVLSRHTLEHTVAKVRDVLLTPPVAHA